MPDQIYKLQPHRTMHLQGFDGYGATAALWGASDSGFTISGVWGEQDDFVVLVLWDADNQFEHPRARYLPDTRFDGVGLAFDLAVSYCVAIDSDLFPWIDWAFLNVTFADGSGQQIRLSDHAAGVGNYVPATAQFELQGSPHTLDYIELAWLDQHFNYQMTPDETLETAVGRLADSITAGVATGRMTAVASGTRITLTWVGDGGLLGKGSNGNRIGVYGMVSGAGTESWNPVAELLGGGLSPARCHVSLDLGGLLTQPLAVQKMWLTFAPPMAFGAPFADYGAGDFAVAVTGWTVTDASARRALQVAGPGSVRIEEEDTWVVRAGYWEHADDVGFWSGGRAIRSAYNASEARTLTIETHCGATHDIYVGTRLDGNCGQVRASLDGGASVDLDCYGSAAQVRRRLFAGVAAGAHVVKITLLSTRHAGSAGWYFYFDFLECAVLTGDVPEAPEMRTDVAVATDYDTDNTYKLSPQRLIWAIRKAGLVGVIDHYCGVFWWPARKMLTGTAAWSQVSVVTFSGTRSFGRHTYLVLGGTTLDHVELIGDTAETTATAFAQLVNQGSTVFWAEAAGAVLTLHGLAGSANYHIAVSVDTHDTAFTATVVTTVSDAVAVEWGVDDGAAAPANSAVAAWHADYFAGLVGAGMSAVVSFSQELVNPPAAWVQRFHDGTAVATATGFGTLASSQCCFSAAVGAYMASAYAQMAGLMEAAGLVAWLQFGEVGWWFLAGGSPLSMAFYDADTTGAFASAHGGGGLHVFTGPGDDPGVNGGADAAWLAGRLAEYVAAVRAAVVAGHAAARFELLWPLDVNLPETRRLNWAVNLPAAWKARGGSGFDSFLCEGFQFGGTDRDLDQVARCAAYPFTELSWDRASCGYLMGLFNAGWPWERDYLMGARSRVPAVKIWAWDHVCLYRRMVPVPAEARFSEVQVG